MTMKNLAMTSLLVGCMASGLAHADYVLDTGATFNTSMPLTLDGANFTAAEFTLGTGATITDIAGYITGGNTGAPGDTFTIALYAANGSGLSAASVWSGQGSYQADGWNGLHNLSINGLTAGNYWAAFEVGAADSTLGLLMPTIATPGSASALAYAFNAGSGYMSMNNAIGVQVSAVPDPDSYALFISGLSLLGYVSRRKKRIR